MRMNSTLNEYICLDKCTLSSYFSLSSWWDACLQCGGTFSMSFNSPTCTVQWFFIRLPSCVSSLSRFWNMLITPKKPSCPSPNPHDDPCLSSCSRRHIFLASLQFFWTHGMGMVPLGCWQASSYITLWHDPIIIFWERPRTQSLRHEENKSSACYLRDPARNACLSSAFTWNRVTSLLPLFRVSPPPPIWLFPKEIPTLGPLRLIFPWASQLTCQWDRPDLCIPDCCQLNRCMIFFQNTQLIIRVGKMHCA